MEGVNTNYNDPDAQGSSDFWATQNFKCVIRVHRRGLWSSIGSETLAYLNATQEAVRYSRTGGNNVSEYHAVTLERYRLGVQLIYVPHGKACHPTPA